MRFEVWRESVEPNRELASMLVEQAKTLTALGEREVALETLMTATTILKGIEGEENRRLVLETEEELAREFLALGERGAAKMAFERACFHAKELKNDAELRRLQALAKELGL